MVECQSHTYVNTLFHTTDYEQFFFHLHGEQQVHVCSNFTRQYHIMSMVWHGITKHSQDWQSSSLSHWYSWIKTNILITFSWKLKHKGERRKKNKRRSFFLDCFGPLNRVWQAVPKSWWLTASQRCVTSQKSENLNYAIAEAWNLAQMH